MARVHVLVVDDSVVIRRILTDALSASPDIDVVGTAATGAIALQKIPQVSPDVVVLDVEMPDMDGIETVRRIRQQWPKLPVIMCSSLTERGAEVTLRALGAGASDYIAKPVNAGQLLSLLRVWLKRGASPAPAREGVAAVDEGRLAEAAGS